MKKKQGRKVVVETENPLGCPRKLGSMDSK